jgi:hypothetical protein
MAGVRSPDAEVADPRRPCPEGQWLVLERFAGAPCNEASRELAGPATEQTVPRGGRDALRTEADLQ